MAFRAFRLDWRMKVLLFWVFEYLPGGRRLYFLAQKRVTKTIPRVLAPTSRTADAFLKNWHAVAAHFGTAELGSKTFFEFGAGWDLFGNIVLWCLGANRQIVYDLTRWARPQEINVIIRHLRSDPPPGAVRLPVAELRTDPNGWVADLKEKYGIDYRAPADASATGLPDGSVDAVVTTSVFEHLPVAVVTSILRECARILQPGGIMSHVIDYSDHYAHSDSKIGSYNFLQFSQQEWSRFNPGIHYQNRLRHVDYRPLFEDAGFSTCNADIVMPLDRGSSLATITLAPEFRGRPRDELLPVTGHYVLRPADPAARAIG